MNSITKPHISLMFSVLLFAHVALAKDRTCAQAKRGFFAWQAAALAVLPVAGWGVGLAFLPMGLRWLRDAARLEAATTIANGVFEDNEINKANRIIDRFYQKLIKKYPTSVLGRGEVIDVLHRYNINSVRNGKCNLQDSLYYTLFPENRVSEYLKFDANWENDRNEKEEAYRRQVLRAVKIRNVKNGLTTDTEK